MKKWVTILLLLSIGASLLPHSAAAGPMKEAETEFRVIVKASEEADMMTELRLQSKTLRRAFLKSKPVPAESEPPTLPDAHFIVRTGGTETIYGIDANFDLYDEQTKLKRVLPARAKPQLTASVQAARQAHYGKLAPWDEVQRIVYRKAVCRVIDLETGLSFNVQRRAGSRHADMQPLTKADTAIMKQVYQGTWSWKRRAVLVEKDGQVLAGSMHGMPHGGDGIPDNDFSGHFCIHFLGSTTHGSSQVDPDHQWMIYKAAGRLDEKFAKATPYEVIDSFLIALNQQDRELLRRGFADKRSPHLAFYQEGLPRMKSVKKMKPFEPQDAGDAVSLEIPVPVTVWLEGQKPERQVFVFTMKRADRDAPWKIDSIHPLSGK